LEPFAIGAAVEWDSAYRQGSDPLGWEFAAVWVEDPDEAWTWVWRRIADDSGDTLEKSAAFGTLEDCVHDARRHGFDESDCGPV
jgi:hypothetical protein